MPVFSTILSGSQGLHLSGTLQHTGSILLDGEIQVGIDVGQPSSIIDGSGSPAITFEGNQNVTFPKAGSINLTIGSDDGGNNRKVTFGHDVVKTVMGIKDDDEIFVINTGADFVASNDIEIDSSGNVTVGNGDLTIDGGAVKGLPTGQLKLYGDTDILLNIDRDNSGTNAQLKVQVNNNTTKLRIDESGNLHGDGVLLMSGSGVSRFGGDVIIEDNLVVDDNVTLGSSNSDTLTINASVTSDLDIADKIRHQGDLNTTMRFPADDKISFEAGGVAMQLWNGNSTPKENVFNESAQDIDFRIESTAGSDNNQYSLYVDGSTGRIGMGYGDANALHENSKLSLKGYVAIKEPGGGNDMMIQLTGSSDAAKIQLYSNNVLSTEINAAGDSVFAGKLQFSGSLLNTEGEDTITFDEDQRVGIGGIPPSYKLDVDGDIRIRGNDIRDNSGNVAIKFDGSANTLITGDLNFDHPIGQIVNDAGVYTTSANQWINFAESIEVVQNNRTQTSMFLISFTGLATNDSRKVSQFLVTVNLTGKSTSPFYYSEGTGILVEPISFEDFGGALIAFDPQTDIKLEYDTDFTSKLWIKSPAAYKNVYVTHLGAGAGNVTPTHLGNGGWKILTGQTWSANSTAGSRATFTGKLPNKQFTSAMVSTIKSPADTGGGQVLSFSGSNINSNETNPVSIMGTGNGVLPQLMITSRATGQQSGPEFNMRKYTSDGTIAEGENMGEIRFMAATGSAPHGFDTVDYGNAATIIGEVGTGTWADGLSHPGRIQFYTTPDGSTSGVERLRIESNGGVIITPNTNSVLATSLISSGSTDTPINIDGHRNYMQYQMSLSTSDNQTEKIVVAQPNVGDTTKSSLTAPLQYRYCWLAPANGYIELVEALPQANIGSSFVGVSSTIRWYKQSRSSTTDVSSLSAFATDTAAMGRNTNIGSSFGGKTATFDFGANNGRFEAGDKLWMSFQAGSSSFFNNDGSAYNSTNYIQFQIIYVLEESELTT